MPARKGDDGGYLLPEVIDPERINLCIQIPNDLNHIIAFWGALQELGHPYNWHNDDDHTALLAAAVWRDIYYNARVGFDAGECAREDPCQTYRTRSPRLTWEPENPYSPGVDVPTGYLFHPWTVVDTSLISTIISAWGLGYEVGDVYTDITKLPPGDWGELIEEGYLFFPHFRVNNLSGAGTVKLHLLNIPQGGRALIVKDGVFDLLNLQLVELNKDLVSIPQETQVPIIVEVEFDDIAEHYVDVVFVPNVNDEVIPFFFGGGIRKVEICGFGLEGCGDMDPCCPEELEIAEAIRVLNQLIVNNQITMIDNDTTIINQNTQVTSNQYLTQYQSFITNNQNINQFNEMIYDGDYHSIAPELGDDFGGTSATDAALCAAIKSYINTLVYVFGMQAAALSGVAALIVGIGLALVPVTFGTSLIGVAAAGAIAASVALWNAVVNDPEAQRKVACCMFDALKDVPISQAAFQASCGSCDLGGVYESNEGFLAAQINACNQLEENWTAFVRALGQSQGGGNVVDCDCGCEGDVVLEDFEGTGTIITPMGNCIYQFAQSTPIEEGGVDRYYHSFKDILDRCLSVQNSDDPAYPTQAQSDHWVTFCNGSTSETVGGITGSDLRQARWREGTSVTYMKITLVEE